jgi:hypothetical protein
MVPLILKSEKNLPIVFRTNNMIANLSSNKDLEIRTLHTPLSNAYDIRGRGGGDGGQQI